MPAKSNENSGLSSNLKNSLEDEISIVKSKITGRAVDLAERHARDPETGVVVSMQDLNEALAEHLSIEPISPPNHSFFDLFPPFTVLCFLLCLIFGALGLLKTGNPPQGFLDIAKIFAGALVGSTASSAIGASKSRSRRS